MLRAFRYPEASIAYRLILGVLPRRFYNSASSVDCANKDQNDILLEVDLDQNFDEPDKHTKKKEFNPITVEAKLKEKLFLGCPVQRVKQFIRENEIHLHSVPVIDKNTKFLTRKGIQTSIIMEHPWLLGFPSDYLQNKFEVVEKLEPRNSNDFVPLLQMSTYHLARMILIFRKEKAHFDNGNRIYFISETFNVEPILVSSAFLTRPSVIEIPVERFKTNAKLLLEHQVPPMKVVQSLRSLRLSPTKVQQRLEIFKQAGVPVTNLTTVEISEKSNEKNLIIQKNFIARKQAKGEVAEYIAERLGYDLEKANDCVATCDYFIKRGLSKEKVKKVLDYLLIEEKYQPFEVALSLYVIGRSLESMKRRFADVKSLGHRPNLGFLMKSTKNYEIYLKKLEEQHKQQALGRN